MTFESSLGNERKITYSRHELDQQLVLAYATTIHKAQVQLRHTLLYVAVVGHDNLVGKRVGKRVGKLARGACCLANC